MKFVRFSLLFAFSFLLISLIIRYIFYSNEFFTKSYLIVAIIIVAFYFILSFKYEFNIFKIPLKVVLISNLIFAGILFLPFLLYLFIGFDHGSFMLFTYFPLFICFLVHVCFAFLVNYSKNLAIFIAAIFLVSLLIFNYDPCYFGLNKDYGWSFCYVGLSKVKNDPNLCDKIVFSQFALSSPKTFCKYFERFDDNGVLFDPIYREITPTYFIDQQDSLNRIVRDLIKEKGFREDISYYDACKIIITEDYEKYINFCKSRAN